MKVIKERENGTKRVFTVNDQPSKTDQQWKEDCDTNIILERFMKTGQLTHVARTPGIFADVSGVKDLLPSMIMLQDARREFDKYPAEIRKKFENKPEKLIEWLQNPENKEEAIELGFLEATGPTPSAGSNPEGGASKEKSPAKPPTKMEKKETKTKNDD